MPDSRPNFENILESGIYTFQSGDTGEYWHMQDSGSNHGLHGRSWDEGISNEFRFDFSYGDDYGHIGNVGKNRGHNRYIQAAAEGGVVSGTEAIVSKNQVFRFKKLGECNRYYMRFNNLKHVYDDGGSSDK
jgi:hypothetical protein